MKRFVLMVLCLLVGGAGIAGAAPIAVTFNSDPDGPKPNGFVSVDSALVSFTDTLGGDLQTGFATFLETNGTNALAVFGDDPSQLQMNFTTTVASLSLEFGNDQAGFGATHAWLRVFLGATFVGQSSVALNLNDLMDQSILFSGPLFDNAFFYYGDAAGNAATLIEVVDNIRFDTQNAVPEPASMLLVGAGLTAALRRRRRHNRSIN